MAMSSSSVDRFGLIRLALQRAADRTNGLANRLGDGDGRSRVGVDADGIGTDRDIVSGDRCASCFGQGAQTPRCCLGRILGVMFARDDESAGGS